MEVQQLDIAFVLDTTGSMQSWIWQVRQQLRNIIKDISSLVSCYDIQCAVIGYKDHCDSDTVKIHSKFTSDMEFLQQTFNAIGCCGGGDFPEAVTDGLYQLVRLNWRSNSVKTAILLGDAPPHGCGEPTDSYPEGCPCKEEWTEQIQACKEMGIVIHAVNVSTRKMLPWEHIASETYGQYVMLSDTNKLTSVITGVVQVDFDKFRLATEVYALITQQYPQIGRYLLEKQRVNWITNKFANVQVKQVNTKQAITNRMLLHNDIRHAIAILAKHAKEKTLVKELFPESSNTVLKIEGGLFSNVVDKDGSKILVPLQSVEVSVQIKHSWATVEITQSYVNSTENSMECSYQFPVDDSAAIYGFTAETEGRKIVAKCMEVQQAQDLYDDSIASGHSAFLLEQKRANVFSMSVGNLLPKQQVTIRINYVTSVAQNEADIFRFVVPTMVAPRYSPPLPTEAPLNNNDPTVTSSELPYKLNLTMDIEMSSAISEISSPTHEILVDSTDNKAKVTLKNAVMNSDFVVLFKQEQNPPFQFFLESNQSNEMALMFSIAPLFTKTTPTLNREVILMLDCSCSMEGSTIEEAKKAAQHFISGLKKTYQEVRFNIICFASEATSLFKKNQVLSDETEQIALEFISQLKLVLGGTQLLKGLNKVKDVTASSPVDMILITDGQFADEQRLVETVAKFVQVGSRLFTIGVGYTVNYNTILMLARIGLGASEFRISEEKESIEDKLNRHLTRIAYSADAVTCDWGSREVFPSRIPSVINNTKLNFFTLLGSSVDLNKPIQLKCCSKEFNYEMELSLHDRWVIIPDYGKFQIQHLQDSNVIHILAGRNLIREYEESKLASLPCAVDANRVVSIATKLCLASSLTSFVAVDERSEAQSTTLKKVDIPVAAPLRFRPVNPAEAKLSAFPSGIDLVRPQVQRSSGGGCCGNDYHRREVARDPQEPVTRGHIGVVIFGDASVGKTCIMQRFSKDIYEDNKPATVGMDFFRKQLFIDGKTVLIQCWDTAGQERYRNMTPASFLLRRAEVVVLAFDLSSKESFQIAIQHWYLETLSKYSIPIILVGNKLDKHTPTEEEQQEYYDTAKKYGLTFMECSAKDGTGVNEMFEHIARLFS